MLLLPQCSKSSLWIENLRPKLANSSIQGNTESWFNVRCFLLVQWNVCIWTFAPQIIQPLNAGQNRLFRLKQKQFSSKVLTNCFYSQELIRRSSWTWELWRQNFTLRVKFNLLSLPHFMLQSVKTVVFSLLLRNYFVLTYTSLHTI